MANVLLGERKGSGDMVVPDFDNDFDRLIELTGEFSIHEPAEIDEPLLDQNMLRKL